VYQRSPLRRHCSHERRVLSRRRGATCCSAARGGRRWVTLGDWGDPFARAPPAPQAPPRREEYAFDLHVRGVQEGPAKSSTRVRCPAPPLFVSHRCWSEGPFLADPTWVVTAGHPRNGRSAAIRASKAPRHCDPARDPDHGREQAPPAQPMAMTVARVSRRGSPDRLRRKPRPRFRRRTGRSGRSQ
jgi:hypothetical protein